MRLTDKELIHEANKRIAENGEKETISFASILKEFNITEEELKETDAVVVE